MNHFPPPSTGDHRTDDLDPVGSRRRGGTVVALAAGVVIGGLVAGTQFAAASTPTPNDEPTSVDAPTAEPIADDVSDSDAPVDVVEFVDMDDPAWAEYEACVSERFGDGDVMFGDGDVMFGDGDVMFGDGDVMFGDGDMTVAIEGDMSVGGDVPSFVHDAFAVEVGADGAVVASVDAACNDLLPDGALRFGDLIDGEIHEIVDDEFGPFVAGAYGATGIDEPHDVAAEDLTEISPELASRLVD